jgi:seryl-tRNA synthetase
MLDIKKIRDNPEFAKKALLTKRCALDMDALLADDETRRRLIRTTDELKAEQNSVSKQIPAMKKQGQDTAEIMERMKALSEEIKSNESAISQVEARIENVLLQVPNLPHPDVPLGEDDSQNAEMRRVGTPRKFEYEPLPHWELGELLGILDPAAAAKVTGARFHFYLDLGARLERSVINFFLNTHTQNGYTEVFPPFMVNRSSMIGTGQLPKFEEDAFRLAEPDYFLIPTAEVPVTNLHRDEILDGDRLPIHYCAYSACFRAEAGSAGRDTRGLIRQHQFNKVELVKFVHPDRSYQALEELTADAERVLQALELPYRVMRLCTGDLGFSSAMTYDIEVWMPSYGRYVEISSCSNFEDYQARRANIRFKDSPKSKAQFVHTLNGSGVAVGRTVAAILENCQQEDGSVRIPAALVPYMGTDAIHPKKW